MSRTLQVVGSDGSFTVRLDGTIVDRSEAGPEYDRITGFDLTHTSMPYSPLEFGEVDICYIGNHTLDGYEPPATFEREGPDGWESYAPRRVRYVTFQAESISYVECAVQVPLDATEEELQEIEEGLDGGDYYETGTDWETSSMWIDSADK